MHEYLVDRETLGQFVDALLTQKYPGPPTEKYQRLREVSMRLLNQRIGEALFGKLSLGAHDEIDSLLDDPNTPPEAFHAFFEKYHLEPQKIIEQVFADFKQEFEGVAYE